MTVAPALPAVLASRNLDLLQVARLIRWKFRPLDTDTEGARASKSIMAARSERFNTGTIDSAGDF